MFTFQEFTEFTQSLLPTIRETIHKYMGHVPVDYKADNSPVTLADKEIEQYIVGRIAERFPESTIVGEESGTHAASDTGSDLIEWIIDPIDGTKSFIHSVPLFATLIGVMVNGRPVYGAIYNPLLDDLLVGDGTQALWNGQPTHVRTGRTLSQALLLVTDIPDVAKHQDSAPFDKLVDKCWLMRTWGDAYGYFLLATGRADVMVDPVMSRWDLAALIPVIEGAGGVITDYHGADAATADSIVASAPALHAEVIATLNP